MSLWKNTDANTSAPIYSPMQVNLAPTQENVDVIYENTTQDVAIVGRADGVFGVDNNETIAQGNGTTHAGWVLRTEGSGGRSGRVFQETLVAMGSMNADGNDDPVYPDAKLTITTQPGNKSTTAGNAATFTVGVTAAPPSAVLAYTWEVNTGSGWLATANGTPANTTYSGNTTASLQVTPATTEANNALYRVTVSSTGAVSVTTANSTLTVA